MNIPFQRSDAGKPKDRHRDCAVIALSNALNVSYFESEKFWADNGRKHNRGAFTRDVLGKNRIVLNHKIELIYSHDKGISLNQFLLRRLPGTYLCRKRGHIFTVRNGVVLSATPEKGRAMLTHIWKVEKTNEINPAPINLITIKPAPVVEKNKLEKFPWLKNYIE